MIFEISLKIAIQIMAIAVLCNRVEKLAKEQNVDLYLGKYDELSA